MTIFKENPKDMTDEELEARYRSLWSSAQQRGTLNVLSDLLSTEMNRRHYEDISRSSNKVSKVSLFASLFALFFASISAYFSYIDWKEDKDWQDIQISTLKEISQNWESNRTENVPLNQKKKSNEKVTELTKTHNKVKNENASKAGTDAQKDARPF